MTDSKLTNFYFCEYTQTFRSSENYWVASIKNNQLVFDSFDSAIIGRFTEEEIIDLYSNILEIRRTHSKLTKVITGPVDHIAVIVKTDNYYGVQYWTQWQIDIHKQTNTDNSISYFVAKL